MKLKSGTTDQYIYFVGFADTGTNPGTNRMTGYSSKFTVRRSRDGGASAAYTTPTINETDSTNMPGVYELLVDEDTTLTAGNYTEAYVLHLNDTGGHVRPVTREIELFKSDTGVQSAVDAISGGGLDTGQVNQAVWGADASRSLTQFAFDTGVADSVWKSASRTLTSFAFDTGIAHTVWSAQNSAYTDTGSMGYGVNIHYLRGDTGAAENLASMFDGTGYTAETGPSSRSQVDAIGAGSGAAFNFEVDTGNVGAAIKSVTFVGVEDTGSPDKTEAEDGVYHQIGDVGNAIDVVYKFAIGGARSGSEVTFKGYVSGGNDTITMQAYDFAGAGWDTIGTIPGQAGTTNIVATYALLSKYTGTGADLGAVIIRFVCTGQSNPTLFVDQLLVSAVNLGQTIGYANGAVWVDTGAANTNTESFVDGTADNPVSTATAGQTIAGNVGLSRFEVAAGSTFTLANDAPDFLILGHEYSISLAGKNVTDSKFQNFKLITDSGIVTAPGETHFDHGSIRNLYIGQSRFDQVAFLNDDTGVNANSAGTFEFYDCHSGVAGNSSPVFNFTGTGSATTANFRRWSGGMDITLDVNVTASVDVVSGGTITVRGTGGSISIRGIVQGVNDQSGGAVTITTTAVINTVEIGNAVWDEADTGHHVAGTMGNHLAHIDTGINSSIDQLSAKVDTGVPASVWQESGSTYTDTGSVGYMQDNISAGGSGLDTGQTNRAVWGADASRTLTAAHDTGVLGEITKLSAKVDTGVPASVWASATRTITSFSHDTGVAQTVWRESGSTYVDTGSVGYMQDNPPAATLDTGVVNQAVWQADASRTLTAAHDTGVLGEITKLSTKVDTGVPASVWASTTRTITAAHDTGVLLEISRHDTGSASAQAAIIANVSSVATAVAVLDTGIRNVVQDVNLTQAKGDTGVVGHIVHAFTDTGAPKANITQVNSTTVTGTGDTGVADAWGPAV